MKLWTESASFINELSKLCIQSRVFLLQPIIEFSNISRKIPNENLWEKSQTSRVTSEKSENSVKFGINLLEKLILSSGI